MSWSKGTDDGHEIIELKSEELLVAIDVARGANVYRFVDTATGLDVLYHDPRGLASHVVGGWYELFPNAGPGATVAGVEVPKHGDVRDLPWRVVDAGSHRNGGWVSLAVSSARLPLELERRVSLEGRMVEVTETVTNAGAARVPYIWGHHITLGGDFVSDSVIELPSEDIVARPEFQPLASSVLPSEQGASLAAMPAPHGATVDLTRFPAAPAAEMLFARSLDHAGATVTGAGLRLVLQWDGDAFPTAWIWMENNATDGEPFLGTTVGLAIEPMTTHVPSLGAAIEAGTARALEPGASTSAWLRATLGPAA